MPRKRIPVRIVVPDTTPFVKLGKIGRLDLLDHFTVPLVVVDQVAHEMRHGSHDQTTTLDRWLGRNANRIDVVCTEIGETFRKARIVDPLHPGGNLGERAVEEYARRYARDTPRTYVPIVLFEDRDVIEETELTRTKGVHLVNIRAWLGTLKRLDIVPDADHVLDRMLEHGKLNPHFEKPARTKDVGGVWGAPRPKGIL